jgi:hypothetical protein
MKRNPIQWLGLVFVTSLIASGLIAASNNAASADPTPTAQQSAACDKTSETDQGVQYNFTTCVTASATSKGVAHSNVKARRTADGRLVLSFIMPDGLPSSAQQNCKTIPAGKSYVNNYYDSTGHVRWIKKTAPAGGVPICFDGHVWRVVKCGNIVRMHAPKASLFKGKYKVVRKQKLWGFAKSAVEGSSHSSVTAVQQSGACAGSTASADADAMFLAKARIKVWAWSMSELQVAVQGAKGKLEVEQTEIAKLNASTLAKGKAKTSVAASIVCNVPPPTTPTTPPTTAPTTTPPTTPPVTKTIKITSFVDLNKIDAGKNSGPAAFTVYASEAGGSATVDPGIGAVSDCNGGPMQGSMTFSNLGSGDNSLCVILWAPDDADKPASMTVTYTATLGSAFDQKTDEVVIGYPVRP